MTIGHVVYDEVKDGGTRKEIMTTILLVTKMKSTEPIATYATRAVNTPVISYISLQFTAITH